jgi:HEAT repeat protein
MPIDKKVRFTETADRLDKLFQDLESKEFRTKNEAIKELSKFRSDKAKDKLFDIVKDPTWNVRLRISAIDSIGRNGKDPKAQKLFTQLIQDPNQDKEVRRAALTHLSRYRDDHLLPIFTQALQDEYRFIRFWAVRGLIKLRDNKATKSLIQALGDEDEEIRKEANTHLESLGATVIKDLVKAFKDPNANKFLRYGLAGILGRIQHPDAVPPLIDALNDGNERVVTIAIRSLAKLPAGAAVKPLIQLAINVPDRLPLIQSTLISIGQGDLNAVMDEVVANFTAANAAIQGMFQLLVEQLAPNSMMYLDDIINRKDIDGKTKAAAESLFKKFSKK